MSDLYSAKILADSVSPTGARLTTFELTFPRFILSEFNTHRVFSRNSASSRAIPVWKQLLKTLEHPFVPAKFGVNQPGMQAQVWLEGAALEEAVLTWKRGRSRAVWTALEELLGVKEVTNLLGENYWHEFDPFEDDASRQEVIDGLKAFEAYIKECRQKGVEQTRYLNVHKQTANRVLEAYTWHTVIVTASEWDNFWALRDSEMAQPEIQHVTRLARALYDASTPVELNYGQWHMPLLQPDEIEQAAADPEYWLKVVTGRCARVSYETHEGVRDTAKDVELFLRLSTEGHMSPLEHVATPLRPTWKHEDTAVENWSGNFRGWKQYRKTFRHEDNYGAILAEIS